MKRTAHIVAGLAFGDEGKGSIVDFLVRHHNAGLVVRYNGGAQAAHNVITPDGRHHTFAQFGSGMFVPGVKTHLSKHMLVNPMNMMCEEEHLQQVGISDAWARTTVDMDCLIITPYQKALNRLQEVFRGNSRHGSCGQGIGITRSDHLEWGNLVLRAEDLLTPTTAKSKIHFHRTNCLRRARKLHLEHNIVQLHTEMELLEDEKSEVWCWEYYKRWPARIVAWMPEWDGDVVFEGAQGVLLDEVHGEEPYRTWTDTTFNNAHAILKEHGWTDEVRKIGVLRTYFTRHGNGPFPTEFKDKKYPEPHNCTGVWQGDFRLGKFDQILADKALKIVGEVDVLALNHCDVVTKKELERVGKELGLVYKPHIVGYGPTAEEKYEYA